MTTPSPQAQQFIHELKKLVPELIIFAHEQEDKIEWVRTRYNWLWRGADEVRVADFRAALGKIGEWQNEFTLHIHSDLFATKIPLEIANDTILGGFFEQEQLAFSLVFEFGFEVEPLEDVQKLAKVSRKLIDRTRAVIEASLKDLPRLTEN